MYKMRRFQIALLLTLVLSAPVVHGWNQENIDLNIKMANLFRSGPPAIHHQTILFTYYQPSFARYVGIAFDFEKFQVIFGFCQAL